MSPTPAPILMLALASWVSLFFRRYQQLTATTKVAPMIQDEVTVWVNLLMANGESATSINEVISKRMVSGLNS